MTGLRSMLSRAAKGPQGARRAPDQTWKPPIVATVAAKQQGLDDLWAAGLAHRQHLESSGRARELAERRVKGEAGEGAAEPAAQPGRGAPNGEPQASRPWRGRETA